MSPPFIFQIIEIQEHKDALSHYDNRGNWLPSTDAGANRAVPVGVSGRLWYCNGQQLQEIGQQLPQGSLPFKRFSVYYSGGYGFWVMRGDATNPTGSEAWHPLRFEHSEQDYSSFLTPTGPSSTLRVQRSDQLWPHLLLPDIYHTTVRSEHQIYGGLTGELPIFLALVAFSTSRDHLHRVLPTTFTTGAWQIHNSSFARQTQRGVVVTVWTCPQTWAGGSTQNDLTQYEDGVWGKYFA